MLIRYINLHVHVNFLHRISVILSTELGFYAPINIKKGHSEDVLPNQSPLGLVLKKLKTKANNTRTRWP